MYDIHADLLDALRATPTVLANLVAGRGQAPGRPTPRDESEWSTIEIVCHLRDGEERALERNRAMRDEQDPFLPGYDQEQWAKERVYAEADLHQALAAFSSLRALHVAELKALSEADWDRPGRHQEQDQITIATHTIHLVSHDLSHLAQIARQ